jgi:acyl CoA:acetate/3-ketoacid CoA transferase beta subunit
LILAAVVALARLKLILACRRLCGFCGFCAYPLTAVRAVDTIFTDVAVIRITPAGLLLEEKAPGWSVEDVQAITEPRLTVSERLRDMPV